MVIDPGSRISYDQLDTATRELAAVFVQAGVGKGTRVGLIMPNNTRWVLIAIALTRIGAVLVPLSTLLRAGELVVQLRVAAVQFLVSVDEFRGHRHLDDVAASRSELPALQQVWSTEQLDAAVAGARAGQIVDAMTQTVTPADPLVIMFTSGSSGTPKGVWHSHGSALGAVRSGLAARCIDADSRLYLPMPFFWVGSFGSGILSALLAGTTLVTEEIPRPGTCDCWKANGSRCFGGGRTRPRPWPGMPAPSEPTSRRCGPEACKPCCRPNSAPDRAPGPHSSA